MFNAILGSFGLKAGDYQIQKFGMGLINHTWKIADHENEPKYLLQRVNSSVFSSPENISANINKVSQYLARQHPRYFLASPLPAVTGEYLFHDIDGQYYRLLPYVKNAITLNTVETPQQAFEAASRFAQFSALLADFDPAELNYTLTGFHDLSARLVQFKQAVPLATKSRSAAAQPMIDKGLQFEAIAATYTKIVRDKLLPLRVIHHDTKISNILFDPAYKGICVIDLDTVMPGFYISDVGDMMRTYLSPANEEEPDLSEIEIREDFFKAVAQGYMSQMGGLLTETEKGMFVYSGKFMIYMQALRFLTDYLSNDIYYQVSHPEHNLLRAQNQFRLLEKYEAKENRFQEIVNLVTPL